MKNLNATQTAQVEALYKKYGRTDVTRSEINDFVDAGEIANPTWLKNDKYKVSRGVYSLPIAGNDFSPSLTDVPLLLFSKLFLEKLLRLLLQLKLLRFLLSTKQLLKQD